MQGYKDLREAGTHDTTKEVNKAPITDRKAMRSVRLLKKLKREVP